MSEWNEENIREHLFTEVQLRDRDTDEWSPPHKLVGYRHGFSHPFLANRPGPSSWRCMRPIPEVKKTWREKLKEKLPTEYFELVCERTPEENLNKEFTGWEDWDDAYVSFNWAQTDEGNDFWRWVYHFLTDRRTDLPEIPKPKKTWEDALREKLPDEYLALVFKYTPNKRLDEEFTRWDDWSGVSFKWRDTPEGLVFWIEVDKFLCGCRTDLPEIPKEEHANSHLAPQGDSDLIREIVREEIEKYGVEWLGRDESVCRFPLVRKEAGDEW